MSFLSNKWIVALICIVFGIIIIIGLPDIARWIIGIVLIVYGILVLLGKK